MNSDQNRKNTYALLVSGVSVLIACGGLYFQWSSIKEMRSQIEVARDQARTAAVQADVAVKQLHVSDVEKFRSHCRRLSEILDPSESEMHYANTGSQDPSFLPKIVGVFRSEIVEETASLVRYRKYLEFTRETRTTVHSVMRSTQDVFTGGNDGSISFLVDAFTSYEAACELEKTMDGEVRAMEYLLLASYANALSGVNDAEKFALKALTQIENEPSGYRHLLLYTTLATLYYQNHPRMSAEKGASYFRKARDLYREIPEGASSLMMEHELWSEWAALEYEIGNATNGETYEKEAWDLIKRIPVSQDVKESVMYDAAYTFESARILAGLPSRAYDLGIYESPRATYYALEPPSASPESYWERESDRRAKR